MVTRTFVLPVVSPTGSFASQVKTELLTYGTPRWSNELPTPKYLGTTGTTTINQAIGQRGTESPPRYRAFEAYAGGLGVGNPYGSLQGWTGPAISDPEADRWWYVAGTTGEAPHSQNAIRYDAATDQFLHWQGTDPAVSDGLFDPYGGPHNFGMTCFDPSARRIYRVTKGTNVSYNSRVGWFDVDDFSSGVFPGEMFLGISYPACEFMPGIGSAGSVCVFLHPGDNVYIPRYDISMQQWVSDIPGTRQGLVGACACAVGGSAYFSYGDGIMYRLQSDKQVSVVPAGTPIPMNGNGVGAPNFCQWVALGESMYAFCDAGPIYRFDVQSQTWSGVLDQMPDRPTESSMNLNYTVAALSQLGAFLLVYSSGLYTEEALLWVP